MADEEIQEDEQELEPVAETEVEDSGELEGDNQPSTHFRDYLRSRGYSDIPDEAHDDTLLNEMSDMYLRVKTGERDLQEYNQAKPLLQEFLQSRADFEEFQKSRQKPQTETQPKPDALKFNPDWDHVTEFDQATNQWKPKGAYGSLAAAQERNRYERAIRERAREWSEDPIAYLNKNGLQDQLKQFQEEAVKRAYEKVRAELSQERSQSEIHGFWQENAGSLYQFDPVTKQPLIDPTTGHPRLSEDGHAYYAAVQRAKEEFGITDQAKAHRFALTQVQITKPQTTAEKNKELKKKFTDRPGVKDRLKGNGGTVHRAIKENIPQTPRMSFKELHAQVEAEMNA